VIKNLKLLRNRIGISQQALAAAVGVSQQSINKYENHNIEPDTTTLMKLADYFETSVDYLIGHTDIDHVIESVSPYDLNPEEIELIDNYRLLSRNQRDLLSLIAKRLLE
jgi:Predicted transcriptional regulators